VRRWPPDAKTFKNGNQSIPVAQFHRYARFRRGGSRRRRRQEFFMLCKIYEGRSDDQNSRRESDPGAFPRGRRNLRYQRVPVSQSRVYHQCRYLVQANLQNFFRGSKEIEHFSQSLRETPIVDLQLRTIKGICAPEQIDRIFLKLSHSRREIRSMTAYGMASATVYMSRRTRYRNES